MKILMIKYDDGQSGRKWWRRSLGKREADKLMTKLEREGKNPKLVKVKVNAEDILDLSSRVYVFPLS
jgi:hypothetical protein